MLHMRIVSVARRDFDRLARCVQLEDHRAKGVAYHLLKDCLNEYRSLAEHYHHRWTAEELLRQHPDLRPQEVYAALAYFYDPHEQMISAMESSAAAARAEQQRQRLSRDELLKRVPSGAP
jgi:hypothetical protein